MNHGILESLVGTQYECFVLLIKSLFSGDIESFEKLLHENSNHQDLKNHLVILHQKIRLMSLVDLVFRKNSDEKNISFEEIAQICKVDVLQVELLLMRAMAVGLIRGTIDQVDQKVLVSWVQPRVLDLKQIESIRDRLAHWKEHVDKMALQIENSTPELFA